jgi:very-short-patch-repair endonuclease
MTPQMIVEAILTELGLEFKKEVRFHPVRKFRFDYQIFSKSEPDLLLALEIDGGNWKGGRHTSGQGFETDHVKFNLALMHGWKVLRYTASQVRTNPAMIDNDIRLIAGI